jgi:glucose-1-phosphate thymidylyltransferase
LGKLRLVKLGRGVAWLDTGTPEALLQASNFIQTIQTRQGLQVACPEEIAFRKGWITVAQLRDLGEPLAKTAYGQYLLDLASEEGGA